jgi:hypothetical protein
VSSHSVLCIILILLQPPTQSIQINTPEYMSLKEENLLIPKSPPKRSTLSFLNLNTRLPRKPLHTPQTHFNHITHSSPHLLRQLQFLLYISPIIHRQIRAMKAPHRLRGPNSLRITLLRKLLHGLREPLNPPARIAQIGVQHVHECDELADMCERVFVVLEEVLQIGYGFVDVQGKDA